MKYNFPMTLDRQFKNTLEELHDKYGTKMMEIEGLSPKQLDTCQFFKNFMQTQTIADATIDDNANVTNRNINTMITEANKPFTKLLSKNKIFIEMKDEFGLETAKEYLESCVNGEIYEHDSHNTSLMPYSYFGDETILVKYKGQLRLISFKELYNIVDEPKILIHENDKAYAKYTNELVIWDNDKWTNVIRVIKKPKQTDFVFIKGSNGVSQIVTTNHPIITTDGNINAENVTTEHKIKTKLPDIKIGNQDSIYLLDELKNEKDLLFNGMNIDNNINIKSYGQISFKHKQNSMLNKIELDEDFGWLYGLLLADGHLEENSLGITQNEGEILDNVIRILNKKNIPYTIKNKTEKCKIIKIRSYIIRQLFNKTFSFINGSKNKKLPSDFLKYNKTFLKSIIGGLLDGDGTLMLNTNRRINIRLISRELLNQVSFLIQLLGYNVRDGKPLLKSDESSKGFKQKYHIYQIAFTPQKNGERFNSIKIKNNVESYLDKYDAEKHCNSKYSFGYGEKQVINHDILEMNYEEYVYDISTETHTFMCNNIVSHNCFAFSISDIVNKGLFFLNEMKADRPKHWDTYNHHILEFVSCATNMLAGAVGLPDYLIYAYYFYYNDTKDMTEENRIKYRNQKFQEFVFNLNQPYLKNGTQSAYTNLSILDEAHMLKFFANKQYPDGTDILEHIDELMIFQKEFLDYIGELRKVKWHTFPVISASLVFKNEKYDDEEMAKIIINHNWKYGFNDVNIMNVEEVTSVSSCCRLTSDISELDENKIFNSIGGSDLNVGSTKVVTINLVRLAILSEGNIEKFLKLVEEKTKLIHKFHFSHRQILQKLIDKGLLPLYTYKLMQLKDQFGTIGINGVFEAMDILKGIERDNNGGYYSENGFKIAEKMFDVITTENKTTKEKYGFVSNVEQIPAESASIKLNKKDRLYFGNQKINNILDKECTIYGNQWIPLKESTNIFNRIKASRLDSFCGGGAILHINLGENFNTFEDAWEFTVNLAKQGVKYFSYISLIDICKNDHSFFGDICPICGEKSITKGIKIVGYLVKQDSFKGERKQELKERKFYKL